MDKEITVYSTPTCPHCDKVKKFLEKHDVEYTEYNVQQNQEKAKEMIEKTGQRSVPVISINGKTVVGSKINELKEILDI